MMIRVVISFPSVGYQKKDTLFRAHRLHSKMGGFKGDLRTYGARIEMRNFGDFGTR